ncbi:MAG: HEAT repeat domain-containing protein [Planctomycetaceae bacterium]
MRRLIATVLLPSLIAITTLAGSTAFAEEAPPPDLTVPVGVETGWYTPHELLPIIAEKAKIRWAMPETLAGNAYFWTTEGEPPSAKAQLDSACEQWGLVWKVAENTGVVTIGLDDEKKRSELATALKTGGQEGVAAAWELGWSRDPRAIQPLAAALASNDPAIALAAAKGIELLEKRIPLGRTDRVDPPETGRVNLATAFPPEADVAPLLDSPYPPVRAAAMRLLFAQGGDVLKAASEKTASDKSDLVVQVRQQMNFAVPRRPREREPEESGTPRRGEVFPPVPANAAEEARTMIEEVADLARRSEWEQMRRRARIIAEWARRGDEASIAALLELSRTEHQSTWYPGYVHMHMAAVGEPRIVARLKEIFAARGADRDTLVRGLERVAWGGKLTEFTQPFLANQTVLYVTANKAGREAYDGILELAGKGDFAAIDALGAIGGPRAVPVLAEQLAKDRGTLMFRAAKALGQLGTLEAAEALIAAADSDVRERRHAATLFLGRIGGPAAITKLLERVRDDDRFIAAAAADALAQIGDERGQQAVAEFRQRDAGLPPLVFQPRNKRFGKDFPVNEWVDLGIRIEAHAAFGEMGWNYDAADKLFFRYGGCSGYTNELTVFDLGTERFVQRRPNEEMAGWDSRRPQRGCSGGREWDPYQKVAWIGKSIGGTAGDLAIAEYYIKGGDYSFSSYDLATDRFRSAPYLESYYGGPPKRFAYDWKNGLLLPVKFSPFENEKPFWAVDTRTDPYDRGAWIDMTTEGDYPRFGGYETAAVDQHTGIAVVYIPPGRDSESRENRTESQTWTFDPRNGRWKNMRPAKAPAGVAGAGFEYDPFHKALILQSGKRVSQYGGPSDSITWAYDLSKNEWTDLNPPNGPGNPWVGAMAFDPEHNAIVLFHFTDKKVMAYRHKPVEPGTRVEW